MIKDKAGKEYWSKVWETMSLPRPLIINSLNPNYYVEKKMHEYFKFIFSKFETKKKSILEVGCGNSVWLPYFAKEYGLEIFGLDYSEIGCEQSKKILEREKVKGEIYLADFFNAPSNLKNKFDFVISQGVLEHFSDPVHVLKIFSSFLKNNGILITEIPNMVGMEGYLHKILNREVYDIHNPINLEQLVAFHKSAGFSIIDKRYLISASCYVNLQAKKGKLSFYKIKRLFTYSLSSIAKIIWFFENIIGSLPTSKLFSPIIFVTSRKD